MLLIERKDLADLKEKGMAMSTEGRKVYGYYAAWNLDSINDQIAEDAFDETIKQRGPRGGDSVETSRSKIKTAYNHRKVLGRPLKMSRDSKGAFYEAYISDTPDGNELLTMVKDGTIDANSFTFRTVRYDYDVEKDIRTLLELKVYEVGPVDFPCNEEAILQGVKSILEMDAQAWTRLIDQFKSGRPFEKSSLSLIHDGLSTLMKLTGERLAPPSVQKDPDEEAKTLLRIFQTSPFSRKGAT